MIESKMSAWECACVRAAIRFAAVAVLGLLAAWGWGASSASAQAVENPLPTSAADFAMPGTQAHGLDEPIPNPGTCQSCHTQPIYDAWRGSMMGQAGRDPLFWAALAVAEDDAPGAGEFCLRCHSPTGWLEGRSHPSDGSALTAADIDAGVACEICHRMVDPQPSLDDEAVEIDLVIRNALTTTVPVARVGSGMMIIDPADNRRGPFSLTPPHTALRTDLLGQESDPVTESRLCGTCHNIDNPALVWTESPVAGAPDQFWPRTRAPGEVELPDAELFPIETTYDEWLYSAYPDGVYAPQFAGARPDGVVASCQDCHMERQTGAAAFGAVARDCRTNGCLPAHTLVGANTWVPQLLKDTRWRLHAAEDAEMLDATTAAARALLRASASITATLSMSGTTKIARVRVVNQTGHKLPTGYAEGRRMWINLRAYDRENQLIYESGAYDDASAELTLDQAVTVYEVKQGFTPAMADLVGAPAGPSFHFALNNHVLKDNRIPPRGFTNAAFSAPGLVPVGIRYDDGQYWDEPIYIVPDETTYIKATVYYQTASKEYIDFLRTAGGADGDMLGRLWDRSKSPPEIVDSAIYPDYRLFLPSLR